MHFANSEPSPAARTATAGSVQQASNAAAAPVPAPKVGKPRPSRPQPSPTEAATTIQTTWRMQRLHRHKEALKDLIRISRNIQDLQNRFSSYKADSQGILSHKQYLELNEYTMRVLLDLDATVCGVTELRQIRKRLTAEAIKLLDDLQAAYSSAVRSASVELGDEVVADVLREASFRKAAAQQQQQQQEVGVLWDETLDDAEPRGERQGRDQDGKVAGVPAMDTSDAMGGVGNNNKVSSSSSRQQGNDEGAAEMAVDGDGGEDMEVEDDNAAAPMESWYSLDQGKDQALFDQVQGLRPDADGQHEQEQQLLSKGCVDVAPAAGGSSGWQHVVQGPAEGVKMVLLHPGQIATISQVC